MKRNPAIYITQSTLQQLLEQVGIQDSIKVAAKIVTLSRPYNLTSRVIVTGRAATKKKITEDLEASADNYTELFNNTLNAIRLSNTYAHAKMYTKGTKDYRVIAKITKVAVKFAGVFSLDIDEAFMIYINIGLKLMGKRYGLSKFTYYEEKIFLEQESKVLSEQDTNSKATLQFYKIWVATVAKEVGLEYKIDKEDYKTWVNFVYARQEADEAKAKYNHWVAAQYEGLAFLDSIPEVYQLHGQGAKDRYTKWKINNKKKGQKMPSRMTEQEQAYYLKHKNKG